MTAYYYNQKEKNKQMARTHTYEMAELFPDDIRYSIDSSVIYDHDNVEEVDITRYKKPSVLVENTDTASSIYDHCLDDKTVALNFASFRNPGGQYINGSMAQEEALCSESFLYNVLKEIPNYYVNNKNKLNGGLYSDKLIYTPSVFFNRGLMTAKCNIITCAAPNMKYYFDYHKGIDTETYYRLLYNRITLIKQVAEMNNNETIILGAWGCGVFKNNPEIVARIFKEVFSQTSIDFVIYAIPSNKDGSANYQVFKRIIEE